jgi:hypothetical protein
MLSRVCKTAVLLSFPRVCCAMTGQFFGFGGQSALFTLVSGQILAISSQKSHDLSKYLELKFPLQQMPEILIADIMNCPNMVCGCR